MSNTKVYYLGEFQPASSILGMFNGTESFIIANPWFPEISGYDKEQDISKPTKIKSANGQRLNSPRVYMRNIETKALIKNYVLAWDNHKYVKGSPRKRYFIAHPATESFQNGQWLNIQTKLKITTSAEPDASDLALVMLNYQLTIGMQILLIARTLDIDLSKYGADEEVNNTKFFERFKSDIVNVINKATGKEPAISFSKEMINSFTNPPVWGRPEDSSIDVPVVLSEDKTTIEEAFQTPWLAVRSVINSSMTKLKDVVKPVLRDVFKTNDWHIAPEIRFFYAKSKKHSDDDTYRKFFNSKIKTVAKPAIDDEKKRPYCMLKTLKKERVMTIDDLMSLWGGTSKTNLPMTPGTAWEGVIFIKPNIDFQYYRQGAPSVVMLANRFTIKKAETLSASDYDDGMDFTEDDGDDENDGDDITSLKKAMRRSPKEDDEYDIDDI